MDRSSLQKWQDPLLLFRSLQENFPKGATRWEDSFKPHRDMWVMSAFAVGYQLHYEHKVEVRLGDCEPADGQIRSNGAMKDFQIVECLRKERKRHDEYREMEKMEGPVILQYEPPTRDEFLGTISEIVEKKINRRYASKTLNLLVYINLPYDGLRVANVCEAVEKNNLASFEGLWLLAPVAAEIGLPCLGIAKIWPEQCGFFCFSVMEGRALRPEEPVTGFSGWFQLEI